MEKNAKTVLYIGKDMFWILEVLTIKDEDYQLLTVKLTSVTTWRYQVSRL